MNKIKILSIALTFLIVLSSFNFSSFADDTIKTNNNPSTFITSEEIDTLMETQLGALLNSIRQNPVMHGFSESEFETAYLGSPFTISNIGTISSQASNDITYIPIISSDTIIAIVTLIKNNNEYCITIGKDFAPNLNKCLQETESAVSLISTGGNIIGLDNSLKTFIISNFNSTDIKNVDISLTRNSTDNNVISKNAITECKYIIPEMDEKTVSLSSYPDLTIYENQLNNYPEIQGSGGSCWAAVVASMVQYELGGSISPAHIYDAVHFEYGTGAGASTIKLALELCLPSIYLPTYYSRRINNSEIRVIIDNNDPACMLAESTNTGESVGHATALC